MGDKFTQKSAEVFFPVNSLEDLAFLLLHLLTHSWQLARALHSYYGRDLVIHSKGICNEVANNSTLASTSVLFLIKTTRHLRTVWSFRLLFEEWELFNWLSSLIELELLFGGWSFSWKPIEIKLQRLPCKKYCRCPCLVFFGLVLLA